MGCRSEWEIETFLYEISQLNEDICTNESDNVSTDGTESISQGNKIGSETDDQNGYDDEDVDTSYTRTKRKKSQRRQFKREKSVHIN